MTPSRKALDAVVERLTPLLAPKGFTWCPADTAVASGGPFANGFFVGKDFTIDLIWRESSGLGLPNFSIERTHAGHHSVMERLGFADQYRFHFDDDLIPSRVYTTTDEPLVDALVADLELLLPVIEARPQDIRRAIFEAHAAWVRKLYSRAGS